MVPNFIGEDQYSSEQSRELFSGHDVIHVISGLGTEITEESLVDAFTFSCTDLPLKTALSYAQLPEVKALFKHLNIWQVVKGSLCAIPKAFKLWRASKQMPKKWPFFGWQRYLDTPIKDIRKEYNIQPQLYS
jgi:ubiquinone biosynthesis protein Coq4